jgi:transcriptional regulator with XRE-family HTH domain
VKARNRLGTMLALYRTSRDISLRDMARESGLSHATLSRIERGYALDALTMIDVWVYLLGGLPTDHARAKAHRERSVGEKET